MDTGFTQTARRELGFVLCVAVFGVAMVLLVAFTPWYESMVLG